MDAAERAAMMLGMEALVEKLDAVGAVEIINRHHDGIHVDQELLDELLEVQGKRRFRASRSEPTRGGAVKRP
jgi:hypothetical protein